MSHDMSHDPIPEAPDRVPGRAIAAVLAAGVAIIAACVVVVWMLRSLAFHGGGRGDTGAAARSPLSHPSEPFAAPTDGERLRAAQRASLERGEWADPAHTRVRLPIAAAIDRYLARPSP